MKLLLLLLSDKKTPKIPVGVSGDEITWTGAWGRSGDAVTWSTETATWTGK